MPTKNVADPVAPGVKRTPSQSMAFGRAQFQRKWRRFADQWSQPKLMKLAELTLGEKGIYSSQIRGFKTGELRDPSPKVFLAVGLVNVAIAAANRGAGTEDLPEDHPRCPGAYAELWEGKSWMVDSEGMPLGPTGLFEAFSGLINLTDQRMNLNTSGVDFPEVCKRLGKWLRFRFMEMGMDFMDPEVSSAMYELAPSLERLLRGQTITAPELEEEAESIADLCKITTDHFWDEVMTIAKETKATASIIAELTGAAAPTASSPSVPRRRSQRELLARNQKRVDILFRNGRESSNSRNSLNTCGDNTPDEDYYDVEDFVDDALAVESCSNTNSLEASGVDIDTPVQLS